MSAISTAAIPAKFARKGVQVARELTSRVNRADGSVGTPSLHVPVHQGYLHPVGKPSTPEALFCGIDELDAIFSKLTPGQLIEWGMPDGLNGRQLILKFLQHFADAAVWIEPPSDLAVFAPAWASQGVDLDRLYFAQCEKPLQQMRPLFLENTFGLIVLDSVRGISRGDWAFLASRARAQRQWLFIIRRYFLSQKQGNAYTALRLNVWQNRHKQWRINFVKGAQQRSLTLAGERPGL